MEFIKEHYNLTELPFGKGNHEPSQYDLNEIQKEMEEQKEFKKAEFNALVKE